MRSSQEMQIRQQAQAAISQNKWIEKAQLGRKSCAYKKARKAALDAGANKETAAKRGRDVA